MSLVANRRFFNYLVELRVGSASDNYSYIHGESSGFVSVSWEPNDPYQLVEIPGAASPIFQLVHNYHIRGQFVLRDLEAVTQLFKTIDVSATAGTQTAMSASSRETIGYMCVVASNTQIVNATDVRTTPTRSFVFTNTRIRRDLWNLAKTADGVVVEWFAESVTDT